LISLLFAEIAISNLNYRSLSTVEAKFITSQLS